MHYENSNVNCSEVKTNVIFFFFKVDKIILSQGIFMINMKALGLIDQKLLARLQFSKVGQDHRVKMLLPVERSCQKNSCEIPKL